MRPRLYAQRLHGLQGEALETRLAADVPEQWRDLVRYYVTQYWPAMDTHERARARIIAGLTLTERAERLAARARYGR